MTTGVLGEEEETLKSERREEEGMEEDGDLEDVYGGPFKRLCNTSSLRFVRWLTCVSAVCFQRR